jgi:hypothetical protein
MEHRFRIRPAPVDPDPDPPAMVDRPPSPASAANPLDNGGSSVALHGGTSSSIVPIDVEEDFPPLPTSSTAFVARQQKRRLDDDVGQHAPDGKAEKLDSTSSPSSSSASSSSASLPLNDVNIVGRPMSLSVSSGSNSVSSPSVPSVSEADMARLVPNYAGRDTLRTRANIDCRSDDMLSVTVRIHKNHPTGTPTIQQSNYNKHTPQDKKLQTVIRYLSTESGLAITAPKVPRYLFKQGNELDKAVEALSTARRQWHDELVNRVKVDFDVVRDLGSGAVDDALCSAVEWVWQHLLKATDTESALWNDPESVTDQWTDLLSPLGSKITSDTHTTEKTDNPFHSYHLQLKGANRLSTHILAAQLWSYEAAKKTAPEAVKAWKRQILSDGRDTDSTVSTDSSSSDSDGDKPPPPPAWKNSGKRAQRKQRRAQDLPNRVAEFERKFMVGATAKRFGADTSLPLLALSTTIRVRAWQTRYVTCLVDNFESMGCDVNDLATDPAFVQMSTSIAGLTHPTAAWCVNQHNGGADVTIFIREDASNALPPLNAKIKALIPSSTPDLRMRTWLRYPDEKGRVHSGCQTVAVCLNEVVPVVPNRRRPDRPSTVPPPPPGCFAQALLRGYKRLPASSTLDHRPNKKQADEVEPQNRVSEQQQRAEPPQHNQVNQQRSQQQIQSPPPPQNQQQQKQKPSQQPSQQTNQRTSSSQQQPAKNDQQRQQQPPKQRNPSKQQPEPSQDAPSNNSTAVNDDHFTSSPAWKALQADNAELRRNMKAMDERMTSTTAKFASDMKDQTKDLTANFADQLLKINKAIKEIKASQVEAHDKMIMHTGARFADLTDQYRQLHTTLAQIVRHLNIDLTTPPHPETDHTVMSDTNATNAAASPASNGSVVANV